MRQSDLFKDKHFWPLFWTQACGAFNDNLFKIALISLLAAQPKGFSLAGMESKTLQTLAVVGHAGIICLSLRVRGIESRRRIVTSAFKVSQFVD